VNIFAEETVAMKNHRLSNRCYVKHRPL